MRGVRYWPEADGTTRELAGQIREIAGARADAMGGGLSLICRSGSWRPPTITRGWICLAWPGSGRHECVQDSALGAY